MRSDFQVHVQRNGRATTITIAGELDLASSPTVQSELDRVAEPDAKVLIMDLRPLAFMDSTGLSLLIKAHEHAQDAGWRFGVVKGSQQVQRLLSITGVAERLTLVDKPEELLDGG